VIEFGYVWGCGGEEDTIFGSLLRVFWASVCDFLTGTREKAGHSKLHVARRGILLPSSIVVRLHPCVV
jgi:hypothetical protein